MKRSACVLLVHENKVLLLKRNKSLKRYPGLYCTPGGKLEENESIEDAVLRELKEETGLQLGKDRIKKFITIDDGIFEINYFIARVKTIPNIRISNEHIGYKWKDIEKDIKNKSSIAPSLINVLEKLYDYTRKEFNINSGTILNENLL